MAQREDDNDGPVFDINNEENGKLVNLCVQYLIIKDQKKLPIKKNEMFKAIAEGKNFSRRVQQEILDHVKDRLRSVFAMNLVDSHDNTCFLVSDLPKQALRNAGIKLKTNSDEHFKHGILMALLAAIYMSNGSLQENEVKAFMLKLGFDLDSKRLIQLKFSSKIPMSKLVNDVWVKQLYLEKNKVLDTDDSQIFELKWGERAHREFDKDDVLEFVGKIMGDKIDINDWRRQLNAAAGDRRESIESSS